MSERPDTPPVAPPTRERYPRMILVCIGISATLFVIIMGALALDFIWRSNLDKPDTNPQAFEDLMEKPRKAYTEPQ
jgi:hypothetical protein